MSNVLPLSNDPKDISDNLQREYALRRFNKDALGMETAFGSPTQKVIGVGKRIDKRNGELTDVTKLHASFYSHVLTAFEYYPIFEHFGITPEDAMDMPVNRWYAIRKASAKLAEDKAQQPDTNLLLIEYLKALTKALGGSE